MSGCIHKKGVKLRSGTIIMGLSLSLKHWIALFAVGFAAVIYSIYPSSSYQIAQELPKSTYDFIVKDTSGEDVSLSNYKGKVLLIVNVASKCGLTKSNYKELNILYEKYRTQGLEILGFPCNQFGWQEPGSNEEIKETVCSTHKAEFPIFQKIEVNGKNAAPLYKFLKSKKEGVLVDEIKWNFTKFLVDRQGNVIERHSPTTPPLTACLYFTSCFFPRMKFKTYRHHHKHEDFLGKLIENNLSYNNFSE